MATLADLLDPASRHRLERLAELDVQDLAAGARQAAVDSAGPGRTAWSIVALALDYSGGSVETARGLIDAIVRNDQIRTMAKACLDALTSDPGAAPEMPS